MTLGTYPHLLGVAVAATFLTGGAVVVISVFLTLTAAGIRQCYREFRGTD